MNEQGPDAGNLYVSTARVAEALGVTRQAVHKKYARRIDPSIDVPRRSRS